MTLTKEIRNALLACLSQFESTSEFCRQAGLSNSVICKIKKNEQSMIADTTFQAILPFIRDHLPKDYMTFNKNIESKHKSMTQLVNGFMNVFGSAKSCVDTVLNDCSPTDIIVCSQRLVHYSNKAHELAISLKTNKPSED